MLTCVINDYLQSNGNSYHYYNDVLGALEGCKLEVYRRLVAPYEDDKIELNGDVYGRYAVVRLKAEAGAKAA